MEFFPIPNCFPAADTLQRVPSSYVNENDRPGKMWNLEH